MIIQIHISLPMLEAQGVKESVAMRLEDMAQVVQVVEIMDDGYGQQLSIQAEQERQTAGTGSGKDPMPAGVADRMTGTAEGKARRIKYLETMLNLFETGALQDLNKESPAYRDELKFLKTGK